MFVSCFLRHGWMTMSDFLDLLADDLAAVDLVAGLTKNVPRSAS